MGRTVIWAALFGIAVVLSWQAVLSDKSAAGRSPFNETVTAGPTTVDPVSSLPSDPQGVLANQPVAKVESPSAEDDPEKTAALISSMTEAEVCNWLAKLTNQDLTGNTGRLLLRRWVELDPAAAINWVAQLGDAGVRGELVDVAAIAWSEKDLPSALDWVESMPEDSAKHQALADVGYEVARTDPVSAMEIATQLPASDYASGLFLHALSQYASADAGGSRQLALALPPGSLRDQALTMVATVQAKDDGEGAARFAVENISPGPDLDRAVMGVVQLWAQNDLPDVSAWVQTFPDSPIRDQAAQSLGMFDAR
jgi:hypothetical protein